MANTHVFETKMADRMQVSRYSVPVYAAIASFEEREKLKNGQSVTRPYLDIFTEQDYTRGSDLVFPDKTETNETLTVQTSKATPFAIDDLDEVQSNFNLMNQYSDRAMRALEKAVDADFLGEVVNATSVVDAADFGGASGDGITLDTTNVIEIHSVARRKLALQNVDIVGMKDPRQSKGNMKPGGQAGFEVVNPYFTDKLTLSLAGRETADGDLVGKNGYKNSYFSFDCYESTNGTWTGVLGLATNPTDGDTIVINGVTIKFVDTLSGGTSEIHITNAVDTTRANLAEWLNAGGANAEAEAATTGYSAASAAQQALLKRMVATNNNTADTLTIVAEGYGYVVVSETLTDATDAWDSEISSQMFGQKGAIDMVLQARPQVKVDSIPKQLGSYVKPYVLYGKKTFLEGANALVNVKLNSSSWV
jgi:hypothetical protein